MPLTPEQVRQALEPFARRQVGELVDLAHASASTVHPKLGELSSLVLGWAIEAGAVSKALDLLHDILITLYGDDYPTLIKTDAVEFEGFEDVPEQ